MRGKKSGLETKLDEKALKMQNIGGDTCHVIHRAVKTFCDPFAGKPDPAEVLNEGELRLY